MKNVEHEVLIGKLKDTIKTCSLLERIDEMSNQISDIRMKTNPSKAAKEYVHEEEAKLVFMQDMIKRCVWEAFSEDVEVVEKSMYYSNLRKHFDIEVIIRKKD